MPAGLRAQGAGRRIVVVEAVSAAAPSAKYLRLWNPGLLVTLVEPSPAHVSCILSNLLYSDRVAWGI